MTLKNISVKKFIELSGIMEQAHETEIDRGIELLACLHEKPEDYFTNMKLADFAKAAAGLNFLSLEQIKPQAKRYIKAGGNVYAPVYDFNKLKAGQFIDVNHFAKDVNEIIENLPSILASICLPTKLTILGRVALPYGSVPHNEVAADMETASIVDAYQIALFFCKVWKAFCKSTGACLVQTILKAKQATGQKLTDQEIKGLLHILEKFGDGMKPAKQSQALSA